MSFSKPRLVHVVWTLRRAGAERMVFDLCQAFLKEYSVEVIALNGGGEMEAEYRAAGITITIAPKTRGGVDRRKLIDWLIARWSEHRPHIVNTHLDADVWAGFACRKLRIPQVITAHSHEDEYSWFKQLLRWRAYRGAQYVVSVSESVQQMVTHRYGIKTSLQSVIPVGIDGSRFVPRHVHHAGDMPHLIMVGRLTKEKGQETVLEALASVHRPWTLEIIGEGPDRISLQRKAEMLGIMPRITFAGSVDNVPERLRHADLFLLASHHEGQAIAVREAAVAQVPILVSSLSIFNEVFPPDTLAFAPIGNVEAWAKAISDILNQYGHAIERAHRARKIVQELYTVEVMKESYNQLYRRLIG